jgi:hypothetical protein
MSYKLPRIFDVFIECGRWQSIAVEAQYYSQILQDLSNTSPDLPNTVPTHFQQHDVAPKKKFQRLHSPLSRRNCLFFNGFQMRYEPFPWFGQSASGYSNAYDNSCHCQACLIRQAGFPHTNGSGRRSNRGLRKASAGTLGGTTS